jgi:hypothetical protein
VKFEADAIEPEFIACHCDMCQRWSSGPFFSTSAGSVTFTGEEHLTRFRSSSWAERGFCNICGSNLFFRVLKHAGYEMCIGAFDDRSGLVMTGEIFVDRKPDGYALAGDHARLTEKETFEKFPSLVK